MNVLKTIGKEVGKDKIDDKAIIEWVNFKLQECNKDTSITSFKVSSALVFLNLGSATYHRMVCSFGFDIKHGVYY